MIMPLRRRPLVEGGEGGEGLCHRVITALDRWMTSRALPVPLRQSARCQFAALPPDTCVRLGVGEDNVRDVAGGPGFSFVLFFSLGVSRRARGKPLNEDAGFRNITRHSEI